MIDLIISATVGAIAGYGICAVMTVGKVAGVESDFLAEHDEAVKRFGGEQDAIEAHARAADLAATKQARIDRALEQVTPGSNATVTRMVRILRGEQGA